METIILLLYAIFFNLLLLALRAYYRPLVLLGRFLVRAPTVFYHILLLQLFNLLLHFKLKQRKKLYEKYSSTD